MKIMMAQMNAKIGDLDGNTLKIIETIKHAKQSGVKIVLFPELSICGYPPEDLLFHNAFIDGMQQRLEQIVRASKDVAVVVGLARRNLFQGERGLYNSVAIIKDGVLLGFQDKWLLPNYDVFNERRYFEPGQETRIWDLYGKRVAVVICEDIWEHGGYVDWSNYEKDPIKELLKYKPDVLLNASASPYQFQKPDVRVNVCRKAAASLECPVFLCCQVGANDQLIFDGLSVYVDEKAKLMRLGKGFEEDEIVVDLEQQSASEETTFEYDPLKDLYSALVLGVRDYFKKQSFTKACLGLSGGIDSALVACIAKDALGPENVLGVFMPSEFTSEKSMQDAKALAANLQIGFKEVMISDVFEQFKSLLKPNFDKKQEDVTEENMQARLRGLILMSLSNKDGYIVLSTGNKSETAMGYCTLYGDMCGGLGVIGDVTKTKVYDLCRWINSHHGKEIVPVSTIERAPTAELKHDQKDLDSLPDYQIVDDVLQGYVEDYLRVDNIAKKYEIPIETVMNLIRKIHAAEYKRRQGPPVLRVSKKSFGVGRVYPIVQGWM